VAATITLCREKFCPVADSFAIQIADAAAREACMDSRIVRWGQRIAVLSSLTHRSIAGSTRVGRAGRAAADGLCAPRSINVFACALGVVQGQIRTFHQRVRVLAMDGIETDPCAYGNANGVALDVIGLRHSLDYF
jgi:hypothetical protein